MPENWQTRFVSLMEEAFAVLQVPTPKDYVVLRRRLDGRLTSKDPWADYRHNTLEQAQIQDRIASLTGTQ